MRMPSPTTRSLEASPRAPSRRSRATRGDALAELQQGLGNRALQRLLDGGRVFEALPATLRREAERGLGRDLSGVKLRRDSPRAVWHEAEALVQGDELHVAPGYFEPDSARGKRRLFHELAHYGQQRAGRVPRHGGDGRLEREADATADALVTGRAPAPGIEGGAKGGGVYGTASGSGSGAPVQCVKVSYQGKQVDVNKLSVEQLREVQATGDPFDKMNATFELQIRERPRGPQPPPPQPRPSAPPPSSSLLGSEEEELDSSTRVSGRPEVDTDPDRVPGPRLDYFHGAPTARPSTEFQIDLSRSRASLDFNPLGSRAFYLTDSRYQGEEWARRLSETRERERVPQRKRGITPIVHQWSVPQSEMDRHRSVDFARDWRLDYHDDPATYKPQTSLRTGFQRWQDVVARGRAGTLDYRRDYHLPSGTRPFTTTQPDFVSGPIYANPDARGELPQWLTSHDQLALLSQPVVSLFDQYRAGSRTYDYDQGRWIDVEPPEEDPDTRPVRLFDVNSNARSSFAPSLLRGFGSTTTTTTTTTQEERDRARRKPERRRSRGRERERHKRERSKSRGADERKEARHRSPSPPKRERSRERRRRETRWFTIEQLDREFGRRVADDIRGETEGSDTVFRDRDDHGWCLVDHERGKGYRLERSR